MGKLVRTIVLILIGFTLASLFVYRLRLGHGYALRPEQRRYLKGIIEAEGQISEVDEGEGRLVLNDRNQKIVLIFDDLTSITDSGETIAPSAITPGAMATVFYTQRNGKNRAQSISLTGAPPARRQTDRSVEPE